MPLYDNQCLECEATYECRQRWSEPTPECPVCGAHDTERLLSINTRTPSKAKQPYDALDTYRDHKVIKSFGNDKRKGGKDTT